MAKKNKLIDRVEVNIDKTIKNITVTNTFRNSINFGRLKDARNMAGAY